ncbi:DUF4148 domain-containing protein [Burkholderia sp. L27(2015)]|uniref:DUF4148 domain-containing protein n=1 Tax=Burkholderia sp. L27(2015) TaxID=1641858 RepID=UPI00131DF428|nr:DUF4148 domain-containing protein [Burkholderia sp. L27(2015)]
MSNFIKALGATSVLSVALAVNVANAQTTTPSQGSTTTRTQQKQQLKTLEQNGYRPGAGDDPQYPNDIQAAEKRSQGQAGGTGAGVSPNGTGPQAQPGTGTH